MLTGLLLTPPPSPPLLIAREGSLTSPISLTVVRASQNTWIVSSSGRYNLPQPRPLPLPPASHFHLDHCGALPYFSEMCGYNGPIYMTHPTKAICPILLVSRLSPHGFAQLQWLQEDYRKITVERKGEQNFFTSQMIKDCMKKVTTVTLHQTLKVWCVLMRSVREREREREVVS